MQRAANRALQRSAPTLPESSGRVLKAQERVLAVLVATFSNVLPSVYAVRAEFSAFHHCRPKNLSIRSN